MSKMIFQNNLAVNNTESISKNGPFVSDRVLLKKRSRMYMDLMAKLDSHTLTDTKGMEELIEAVREEFGTADVMSLPLGIVCKCFLGLPYEVHILDLSANHIIKHYKKSESMHADFEKARTLAMHHVYAMVEVYSDKMIVLRDDGTATKM